MSASEQPRADVLARSGRPSPQRVPDFFVVGHKKSGTTALHEMLSQHPQIFMPKLKEPHFFATDRQARFRNPRGHPLPETLEDYLALFADAGEEQLAGEASASYLWSHVAAEGIARANPRARIIAVLREPASFLRSQHLQFVRIHFEDRKDMREAIELEDERREGRHIPASCPYPAMLLYSEHLHYAEQLRRYHERFPREQVLVLIYDDFRADNDGTLRRILEFLGVDANLQLEEVRANATTRTMRSQQLDDALLTVTRGRGPLARSSRTLLKAMIPRRARKGAIRTLRQRVVYAAPPSVDEELMLELRRRFKPEVEAASEYIGRDLVALWGYDQLG